MGQGRIKNVEEYIKESLVNIRDDRAVTSNLLTDLLIEMKKAGDLETHKQLGLIASKYVETLQRSNEQLVKLTALLSKKQGNTAELDEADKQELFDLIQGERS